MYEFAEALIEAGHAYVDAQSADEMRQPRHADRTGRQLPGATARAESLALLREMRDGKHPDGSLVLRAKINMASPNINDPVMYRVRHAHHHRTAVHLPDVQLGPPGRGRARRHHAQRLHAGIRRPAPVLRLDPGAPGRTGQAGAAAAPVRIRPPEPGATSSPASASCNWCARATSTAGTIPACPPSSACAALHRVVDPPVLRPHRRVQVRLAHRLQRWSRPCATTWIRWRALGGGAGPAQAGHHHYPEGQSETCTAPRNPHDPRPASANSLRRANSDRARRLPRGSAEEVLPPVPRQHCAPEVRLVRCTGFTKNEPARSWKSGPNTWTPRAARRAPTASRSRATSPGQRRACRARADPSV